MDGAAAAGGAVAGAGSDGFGAGGVAQAASSAIAPPTATYRSGELLTDTDQHRIEIRAAQSRAQPIELGQVRDRPDAHAVPHVVVDRHALHVGVDALFF